MSKPAKPSDGKFDGALGALSRARQESATPRPETLMSGHHETPTSGQDTDAREKYSTVLPKSLKKRLKVYAAENELDDCDVVSQALQEFFERRG